MQKVVQLKEKLRAAGLTVSGNKAPWAQDLLSQWLNCFFLGFLT